METEEQTTEAAPETTLQSFLYFPAAVYVDSKPEFLDVAREVVYRHIDKVHEEQPLNDVHPVTMTGLLMDEPDLEPLREFIGKTGWSILAGQGYAMENVSLTFSEFWAQEHRKTSSMDAHPHGHGVQLAGFYFLDVPTDPEPPRAIFHDPRPGKVMVDMSEQDRNMVTYASSIINFVPEEGMVMFTNAWLPHAFSRNPCDKPFRFIHFNLSPMYGEGPPLPEVV
jgi:hypothetical protein